MRALPGTAVHRLVAEAGATVLDSVPASRIEPVDPAVREWIDRHEGPARPLTELSTGELTDLWVRHYRDTHQHFGVTDDEEVLRARLGGFVERLVIRETSRFVTDDGRPVALALTFREGPVLMGLVDSLEPDHPEARRHVEVALAALLRAVPQEPLEFDGHASGRHWPAVLATVPNVGAGDLTPMDMLRL